MSSQLFNRSVMGGLSTTSPAKTTNPADLQDPLFNIPPEVLVDPIPFIALCGLDVTHNAIHRIIWDGFAANRTVDRLPILYRALPADHEFPVSKIKKSYEYGTIPGGILKSNWIRKHLYEVPALVVLFVELEWDDPAFAEKKIACSSKVATIRSSLAGRSTRIALVLIQSRPHVFAPGEPSPDAEKITSMCNACELAFKQLFLLPNNDNLAVYVVRLETALFEMVQQYYLNEAKRVRGHRDAIMRMQSSNLPLLMKSEVGLATCSRSVVMKVRHQFKIGYFNEFRQDRQTSLKHYQQSYQSLQQIRQDGGFEVKTVAMIIMYRICRLSFRLNCPVDAITNFRKHLDVYRTYKGPPELAYQHEAWLFRQNYTFAIVFDEAIQSGLAAIPSENPGMYFTKAADHMKLRQRYCANFPPSQIAFQPAAPTEGEFYGQLMLSVPSNSGDMPIAVCLQNCERIVNHTGWMIHLLSNAIAQFKKHRCNKTALMLFSRIGDEYCDVGLYEKAHMLFSQGLKEYRRSKWSVIFSQVLLRHIKVCAMIPNVPDFIRSTLEAIGAYSYLQYEDRVQLQNTLQQILSGDRPDFRLLLGSQSQIAYQKWGSIPKECINCTVDMDNVLSCLQFDCSFDRSSFNAHETVSISVRLTLTSPLPLRILELHLMLSNPTYNSFCSVHNTDESMNDQGSDLSLVPGEDSLFRLQFVAQPEDVGKRIDITKFIVKFGSSSVKFTLVWTDFGKSGRPRQISCGGQAVKILDTGRISVRHSTEILRRPALADIHMSLSGPLLVGETYKLPVKIINKEGVRISSGTVGITCDDPSAIGKIVFGSLGSGAFANECSAEIAEIDPEQELQLFFLIRCSVGLKTAVKAFLSYDLNDPFYRCLAEAVVSMESMNPLQIKFLSKEFHNEEYPSEKHVMPAGDDMVYFVIIRNASPVKIILGEAELKLDEAILKPLVHLPSYLKGLELAEDEEAQEALFLHVHESCIPGSSIPMGPLVLTWNRFGSDQAAAATYIPVPDMLIKTSQPPLKVYLSLPPRVTQFEPLILHYKIENTSDLLLDIHALLSTNDEYVLAGEKETRVRLGPGMNTALYSSIIPINVGYMRLPEFEIRSNTDIDCREWIESRLPKTVFVMPKELGDVEGVTELTERVDTLSVET